MQISVFILGDNLQPEMQPNGKTYKGSQARLGVHKNITCIVI